MLIFSFRQASHRLCSPLREEWDWSKVGPWTLLHPDPRAEALCNLGPVPRQRKELVFSKTKGHFHYYDFDIINVWNYISGPMKSGATVRLERVPWSQMTRYEIRLFKVLHHLKYFECFFSSPLLVVLVLLPGGEQYLLLVSRMISFSVTRPLTTCLWKVVRPLWTNTRIWACRSQLETFCHHLGAVGMSSHMHREHQGQVRKTKFTHLWKIIKHDYKTFKYLSGGTGKVVIFVKCNSELLRVEKVIDGENFASSFGYSLASADINGDGFQVRNLELHLNPKIHHVFLT